MIDLSRRLMRWATVLLTAVASLVLLLPSVIGSASSHAPAPRSKSISVNTGRTTTVNAPLAPGGHVTGRVTDKNSGLGIGNVSVHMVRQDVFYCCGAASTNASGYYTITIVQPGVYAAYFYPPLPYFNQVYKNFPEIQPIIPTLITVTSGFTASNINAELTQGFVISGTVVDASSHPIAGLYVDAYRSSNDYVDENAPTDSLGHYQVGPLYSDSYRIRYSPGSGQPYESAWYSNSVTYRGARVIRLTSNLANIDEQLANPGVITGSVIATSGVPISNVTVEAYPAGTAYYAAYAHTDANGQYTITYGLGTGWYQVQFYASGYTSQWYNADLATQQFAMPISITSGLTRTNINAQLSTTGLVALSTTSEAPFDRPRPKSLAQPDRLAAPQDAWAADPLAQIAPLGADQVSVTTGSITGSVTLSGTSTPVPAVKVFALIQSGCCSISSYTGLDGSYHIGGLSAGAYKLQFIPPSPYVPEYYSRTLDLNTATVITVSSGITTEIDMPLVIGHVITGIITARDTGRPLPGAYIEAYSGTQDAHLSGVDGYADLDGRYQTNGLLPGTYKIVFYDGPWPAYATKWYSLTNDALGWSAATVITVAGPGTTRNIDGQLDRPGSISGFMVDRFTGFPVYSAYVEADNPGTCAYVNSTYANSWGFYHLYNLASGPYALWAGANGYQYQYYNGVPGSDCTLGITVAVTASTDTPNINFYLSSYQVFLPLTLKNP